MMYNIWLTSQAHALKYFHLLDLFHKTPSPHHICLTSFRWSFGVTLWEMFSRGVCTSHASLAVPNVTVLYSFISWL